MNFGISSVAMPRVEIIRSVPVVKKDLCLGPQPAQMARPKASSLGHHVSTTLMIKK